MNNTYHIKEKPIKEILDSVDSFLTNMKLFTDNHEGYTYDIKIYKMQPDVWNADITITKQKRENYKTFRETI